MTCSWGGAAFGGVRGAGRARPDRVFFGVLRAADLAVPAPSVPIPPAIRGWRATGGRDFIQTPPLPLKHEGCERRFRSNSATPPGGM